MIVSVMDLFILVLPIVGANKMTGDEDLGTCYWRQYVCYSSSLCFGTF